MTLAIIISPYNAPTPEARAANVRLGIALARWAAAQGYTPVGWWCDIDPANPESDADPVARAAALTRSAERARMVGAAGGVAVRPVWIARTNGMHLDLEAFEAEGGRDLVYASKDDLAPYLPPEPVPTVPRAAVQAAVDKIAFEARGDQNTARHDRDQSKYYYARLDGRENDLAWIERHTGVTSSEVPS